MSVAPNTLSFVSSRETAAVLFRLLHLQFRLSRTVAGWVPSFHSIGQQCELAQVQFEDMEAAAGIHERMTELPTGLRRAKPEGAFADLLDKLADAPTPNAFWLGVFEVMKPALVKAYARHLDQTHALMDTRTVEVLRRNLANQQEHLQRNQIATDHLSRGVEEDAALQGWLRYLRGCVGAAGGLLGEEEATPVPDAKFPPFEVARFMRLEPRQSQNWHGEYEPPIADARVSNYFLNTEIAAVDMLGRILFEVDDMPWEFYFDSARHMWDEARHFRMGRTRLIELGYDPYAYAIPVGHYTAHCHISPLESYAELVLIGEAGSFEYKRIWKEECLKLGDEKSSIQQDFDIVDEQRHVAYGKRWLPVLKDLQNDPRSVEEIAADGFKKMHHVLIAEMTKAGEPIHPDFLAGKNAPDWMKDV